MDAHRFEYVVVVVVVRTVVSNHGTRGRRTTAPATDRRVDGHRRGRRDYARQVRQGLVTRRRRSTIARMVPAVLLLLLLMLAVGRGPAVLRRRRHDRIVQEHLDTEKFRKFIIIVLF